MNSGCFNLLSGLGDALDNRITDGLAKEGYTEYWEIGRKLGQWNFQSSLCKIQ